MKQSGEILDSDDLTARSDELNRISCFNCPVLLGSIKSFISQ